MKKTILTRSEIYPDYKFEKEKNVIEIIKCNNEYQNLRKKESVLKDKLDLLKNELDLCCFSKVNFFNKLFSNVSFVFAPFLLCVMVLTLLISMFSGLGYLLNYSDYKKLENKYSNEDVALYDEQVKKISEDFIKKYANEAGVDYNDYVLKRELKRNLSKINNYEEISVLKSGQKQLSKMKGSLIVSGLCLMMLGFFYALIYLFDSIFVMPSLKEKISKITEDMRGIQNTMFNYKNKYEYLINLDPVLVNHSLSDYLNTIYNTSIIELKMLNKRTFDAVYCSHNKIVFNKDINENIISLFHN